MSHNVYLYILVMAAVTYLIRMLPLALAKNEIRALIAAYKEKSLITVALLACAAVFIVERVLVFI